jgi:ubiquinone biosynthesis protein Coq4
MNSLLGSIWVWARGCLAALRLLKDPNDLDEVFKLDAALPKPKIDVALPADRTRVDIDLAQLRLMPEGTFGRAVADFFDANGLDPKSIPKLEAMSDREWITAHLYETHDLWHVALGFGTNVAEELGLQAVYAAQLPGRLAPILIAGGLLRAALWRTREFPECLAAVSRGHAVGKACAPLVGVAWNDMWTLSPNEVRARIAAS